MELGIFAITATLTALIFIYIRGIFEWENKTLKTIGTILSTSLAILVFFVVIYVLAQGVSFLASRITQSGVSARDFLSVYVSLPILRAIAEFLLSGIGYYVALGIVQGATIAAAFSLMKQGHPLWKAEDWHKNLGRAAFALPLPAALALLALFYQDNRERFSAVDIGVVRLALNPAPSSTGAPETGPQRTAELSRGFPTAEYIQTAKESLDGTLRQRDLSYVSILQASLPESISRDFILNLRRTSALEDSLCTSLKVIDLYVRNFEDYNLLTIDMQKALITLHSTWLSHMKELDEWATELSRVAELERASTILAENLMQEYSAPASNRHSGVVSEIISKWNHEELAVLAAVEFHAVRRAAAARIEVVGVDIPWTPPSACVISRSMLASQSAGADPTMYFNQGGGSSTPPQTVLQRIADIYSPYLVIGLANFYSAIGSYETAYLLMQGWLTTDEKLRNSNLLLKHALPNWYPIRVRIEATRFLKQTSQTARLSEAYRRHLGRIVRSLRDLSETAGLPLSMFRTAPDGVCNASATIQKSLESRKVDISEEIIDRAVSLMLTAATYEAEYYDVTGIAGLPTRTDMERSKVLSELDFRCFIRNWEGSKREDAGPTLEMYRWNAVASWGRLAVRWLEAQRALHQADLNERKRILADVRSRVGVAVERLEAMSTEDGAGEISSSFGQPRAGSLAADYARQARRVLQEALALGF